MKFFQKKIFFKSILKMILEYSFPSRNFEEL